MTHRYVVGGVDGSLGSVSQHCLHHAHCAVIVVPR